MDICSYENLNQFPKQKANSRRLRKSNQIGFTNRSSDNENSFHSTRDEISSLANRTQCINATKLTIDEIQMQRRSIDDGIRGKHNSKMNPPFSSPNTTRRSTSSVIPYLNKTPEKEVQRKYSTNMRTQNPDGLINYENRLKAETVNYQNSRRNTEILTTQNFLNMSSFLDSNSRSTSSKSSEEFNSKTRSWCSNDSDFLSPDRYQPYEDFRKSSSLSVPESNLLKSKSFSSFKIDKHYENQNSQDIINVETLVVPPSFNNRLIRHKSCDGSPCQNYMLNIPDKNQSKRSKKKNAHRKYSHQGDTDNKNEKTFWSQAIMSLKRKQEAFFKKLPKPHQSEEIPPAEEECTVDPVYHLLRCASYTAHNPHTCECPCHTLPNPEVLKHAQSQIQLPTINFKSKSK